MSVLLLVVLMSCAFVMHLQGQGGRSVLLPGAGVAACSLALATVVVQWLRHPGGVKDFLQGGVVDVTCATESRLSWFDWAIVITRRGTIDRAGGWLRLQRSLFFGLIPLATVVKPVGEFYRVEVLVEPRKARRRRHGDIHTLFDDGDYRVIGYTYTVFLVDRRGDRLCVLDLATGVQGNDAFIGRLRGLLEQAVGRPGEATRGPARGAFPQFGGPPVDDAPAPAPEAPARPPVDDFDAWRARRGKRPTGR